MIKSSFKIIEHGVEPSTTFIIVTDGSSSDGKNLMSFGWKMSLQDEIPLVEHYGPAFCKATSFRAEGYGLLSVALFLKLAQIYTKTKIQAVIEICIANKGMVIRSNAHMSYPFDYNYNTLEPDWDVLTQVALELNTFDPVPFI
eukprot:24820-Ditylum_brightwellii.AAC.1